MNGIMQIIVLLLNTNLSCNALPADLRTVNGDDYQVIQYVCAEKTWTAWQKKCPDLDAWGFPFQIYDETGAGWYLNRFAEMQTASIQVMPEDVYAPRCGS